MGHMAWEDIVEPLAETRGKLAQHVRQSVANFGQRAETDISLVSKFSDALGNLGENTIGIANNHWGAEIVSISTGLYNASQKRRGHFRFYDDEFLVVFNKNVWPISETSNQRSWISMP